MNTTIKTNDDLGQNVQAEPRPSEDSTSTEGWGASAPVPCSALSRFFTVNRNMENQTHVEGELTLVRYTMDELTQKRKYQSTIGTNCLMGWCKKCLTLIIGRR